MQTNVASIPMTGLSGPPLASGRPAVPISGFTHPLTEVFHVEGDVYADHADFPWNLHPRSA